MNEGKEKIGEAFITIITSTYNAGAALKITADSIRSQTYKNFQWIIADGLSTDETISIIEANLDLVDVWFSRPDKGIYDAWNKALPFVKGKWIQFLGAGDEFLSEQTLDIVSLTLKSVDSNVLLAYGRTQYIDEVTREIKGYAGKEWEKMKRNWDGIRPELPSHPSVFHHVALFSDSTFDSTYKIAGDSHFLLKCVKHTTPYYIPYVVDKMPLGGISGKISSSLRYNDELLRACRELGIYIPLNRRLRSKFLNSVKKLLIYTVGESNTGRIFNAVYGLIGKPKIW